MKPLIYLACPYSHPNPDIKEKQFEAANMAAARLFRQGLFVFSPISHTHPIARQCDLPGDWRFWAEYDKTMLSLCSELRILRLDGWQSSVGIACEREFASKSLIPITYIDP